MSRRRRGMPLWLSLLILAVAAYGVWELTTNPAVQLWIEQKCGWSCR